MENEKPIYEGQFVEEQHPDPDLTPIRDRKLIAQPYDLAIDSLIDQIERQTLHLRPLSNRPNFQRRYVWSDNLASKLIESILLNVPIPPVYLSQNEDFELDVIDGQQRIYSIYRFMKNQFRLNDLEVIAEYNKLRYFELPPKDRRKLDTYTLRCVIITNDSHPEIRFDVFERLNTNTVPLNAQELRNCIYRGALIDLLDELAANHMWLSILNRKQPDKRMGGEELILRFFAFQQLGLASYKTPQKHWLNEAAEIGKGYSKQQIEALRNMWLSTLEKCLMIFEPLECFRRLPLEKPKMVINRALMDLTMNSLVDVPKEKIPEIRMEYRKRYIAVITNEEFDDLITRAIDHKSRTLKRFEIWDEQVNAGLI
ncbi:MAG: DUF262 domain-containing protein [Anaerolineae bacterium]|nr:DUF262 domain-containing protein [Anaerolineae bacterium]